MSHDRLRLNGKRTIKKKNEGFLSFYSFAVRFGAITLLFFCLVLLLFSTMNRNRSEGRKNVWGITSFSFLCKIALITFQNSFCILCNKPKEKKTFRKY